MALATRNLSDSHLENMFWAQKARQTARNGQWAQGSTRLFSSFINLKYQLRDVTPFLSRQNVLSTLQDVVD